jgi:4-hydroxybenzoate polyprenyltransferase
MEREASPPPRRDTFPPDAPAVRAAGAAARRPRSRPRALIDALRLQQWVKNLLVFLPLVLAHRWLEAGALARAGLAFVAMGLAASSVYVLNDVVDVESDRHHPTKRRRPFASGDLPLGAGRWLVPALALAAAALAAPLGAPFFLLIVLYFVLTTAYSTWLKQIVLVDILVLASLYTLRILAGAAATSVPVSEWLLAFSTFLFFSLAAVKRYGELLRLRGEGAAEVRGRGYVPADHELIVQMGLASGYLAVLVLALYVQSDAVRVLYHRPLALWLACPLLLYWISRMWLLVHRGQITDDPLDFAVRDRVTWGLGAAAAGVVLAAKGALGF